MPTSERALPHTLTPRQNWTRSAAGAKVRGLALVRPLLMPLAAAVLVYVVAGALLHSSAFHFYEAGRFAENDVLRQAIYILAPNGLLNASRYEIAGVVALLSYAGLAVLLLASWCWAMRAARSLESVPLGLLLLLTTVLALPTLGYTTLFSDDIYLYHLYGRTIETYHANPILTPPAAFTLDPHLQLVYWKDLPSSYGPLWLMLSSALSRLAGDSINAAVLVYRLAALALHLSTAAAVWYAVRGRRGAAAATIFYAWNPLVILEIVANAHNDVMVALFAVAVVAAAASRSWAAAACFAGCAVMVKPFAVILLPPVALRILQSSPRSSRWTALGTALAALLVTIVALSLPLWAGTRLLSNVMNNPASHMYTNTVWELISVGVSRLLWVETVTVQHPYLDVVRQLCFVAGALWILTRWWSRRGVAHSAFSMWIVFLLTACWAWPWYFVPAIALAALSGRGALALGVALTAGGLLFWTAWPPPTAFAWMHTWRSLVLFGPVLLAIASPRVRLFCLRLVGEAAGHPQSNRDAGPVQLQTATG